MYLHIFLPMQDEQHHCSSYQPSVHTDQDISISLINEKEPHAKCSCTLPQQSHNFLPLVIPCRVVWIGVFRGKSRFSNGFFSHNGVEIVNFIKNYWSQENVFISTKRWENNWGKKLRKHSLEKGGEKLPSNPSAAFMKSSGTLSWNFSRISCSFCVLQESYRHLRNFARFCRKYTENKTMCMNISNY